MSRQPDDIDAHHCGNWQLYGKNIQLYMWNQCRSGRPTGLLYTTFWKQDRNRLTQTKHRRDTLFESQKCRRTCSGQTLAITTQCNRSNNHCHRRGDTLNSALFPQA